MDLIFFIDLKKKNGIPELKIGIYLTIKEN